MGFATIAQLKDRLSYYLTRVRKGKEPIIVTRHGRPWALIQPFSERDLEELEWRQLARARLQEAWEGESDELYDYL